MSKYGARPVDYDGYHFDSQKECTRYQELKLMEMAGEITDIDVHPKFVLQSDFISKGKKIQPITYSPDFTYFDGENLVAEEVKGGSATRTTAFEIKRKMFLYRYPEYDYRIV